MAWVFLQADLAKLFEPGGWTAAGYLASAIPEGNPFGLWDAMAGIPLVDGLVVWGQILIGLDEQLEATSVVENNRWLRYLLG